MINLRFLPGIDSIDEAVDRELAQGSLNEGRTSFKPDSISLTDRLARMLGGYNVESLFKKAAEKKAKGIEKSLIKQRTAADLATEGTNFVVPSLQSGQTAEQYAAELAKGTARGNLVNQIISDGGTDQDLKGVTSVAGLRTVQRNVAERKKAEEEAKAERLRLESLKPAREALAENKRQFNITARNQIDAADKADRRYYAQLERDANDRRDARAEAKELRAMELDFKQSELAQQREIHMLNLDYKREQDKKNRRDSLVAAITNLGSAFLV